MDNNYNIIIHTYNKVPVEGSLSAFQRLKRTFLVDKWRAKKIVESIKNKHYSEKKGFFTETFNRLAPETLTSDMLQFSYKSLTHIACTNCRKFDIPNIIEIHKDFASIEFYICSHCQSIYSPYSPSLSHYGTECNLYYTSRSGKSHSFSFYKLEWRVDIKSKDHILIKKAFTYQDILYNKENNWFKMQFYTDLNTFVLKNEQIFELPTLSFTPDNKRKKSKDPIRNLSNTVYNITFLKESAETMNHIYELFLNAVNTKKIEDVETLEKSLLESNHSYIETVSILFNAYLYKFKDISSMYEWLKHANCLPDKKRRILMRNRKKGDSFASNFKKEIQSHFAIDSNDHDMIKVLMSLDQRYFIKEDAKIIASYWKPFQSKFDPMIDNEGTFVCFIKSLNEAVRFLKIPKEDLISIIYGEYLKLLFSNEKRPSEKETPFTYAIGTALLDPSSQFRKEEVTHVIGHYDYYNMPKTKHSYRIKNFYERLEEVVGKGHKSKTINNLLYHTKFSQRDSVNTSRKIRLIQSYKLHYDDEIKVLTSFNKKEISQFFVHQEEEVALQSNVLPF